MEGFAYEIGSGIEPASIKAAHLHRLSNAGLPVLSSFVMSENAFAEFCNQPAVRKITKKIKLPGNPREDRKYIRELYRQLRLIGLPDKVRIELQENIDHLAAKTHAQTIVIRLSEEIDHTLHHSSVTGPLRHMAAVEKAVIALYANFLCEKIFNTKDISHSLIIQPAITSYCYGFLTTGSPSHNEVLVIEAIFGSPMTYALSKPMADLIYIDKDTGAILSHDINRQMWRTEHHPDAKIRHIGVPFYNQATAKLDAQLARELVQLAKAVEAQLGKSYRVHWIVDEQYRLWITDLEPITRSLHDQADILLQGHGASPGVVSGPIRRLRHKRQKSAVMPGEIIVTELPELIDEDIINTAAAGVIDTGQLTHETVTRAREGGLPLVIAAGTATDRLKDGLLVTIDGEYGHILRGKKDKLASNIANANVTGTKVYTRPNIDMFQVAPAGDGLCPISFEDLQVTEVSQEIFSRTIGSLAIGYAPLPIFYRLSDDSRLLSLEIAALRELIESTQANIQIISHSIQSLDNLLSLKQRLANTGFFTEASFRLWLNCKLPATVLLIEQFCEKSNIDGIFVDLDELTKLNLGLNEADQVFYEPSTLASLSHIAKVCRTSAIPLCVAGSRLDQAKPDFLEELIKTGVTALTVPSDALNTMRHFIASAEHHLLLNHALEELHQP